MMRLSSLHRKTYNWGLKTFFLNMQPRERKKKTPTFVSMMLMYYMKNDAEEEVKGCFVLSKGFAKQRTTAL